MSITIPRSLVDSGGYANRQHELDLEIAEDFVGCPHVPAMVCLIFFQSVQIPVFSHGFSLGIPLERWEHWVCHGKGVGHPTSSLAKDVIHTSFFSALKVSRGLLLILDEDATPFSRTCDQNFLHPCISMFAMQVM